jgi:hypothetical protein
MGFSFVGGALLVVPCWCCCCVAAFGLTQIGFRSASDQRV